MKGLVFLAAFGLALSYPALAQRIVNPATQPQLDQLQLQLNQRQQDMLQMQRQPLTQQQNFQLQLQQQQLQRQQLQLRRLQQDQATCRALGRC
jgi:hypothetical protein